MKTTDSVKDKFIKWLVEESGEPEHLVMLMQSVYVNPESMFKFYSHSLAEARREEREQRDNVWKKIIACHNCNGTGRTDNIGGAMECIECGGQCHNLVRYDGIHIDDLLTGDNPERKV